MARQGLSGEVVEAGIPWTVALRPLNSQPPFISRVVTPHLLSQDEKAEII